MKIFITLSETNEALLNRVSKEKQMSANDLVNDAIFDMLFPKSGKLQIEASFILQKHEAGTLNAWLVKQSIARGIRWLATHPIQDRTILVQILDRFSCCADDSGKISTCHKWVLEEMDKVISMLKERVPGYIPSQDKYNRLAKDILINWRCIWREEAVYSVLSTIVFANDPKKDFDWYDGLKFLYLIDLAAWKQACDI